MVNNMYDCVKIRGQTVPLGYILYTKVSMRKNIR